MRNPNWTVDELILALDLYFKVGRTQPDKNHSGVVDLSKLLNSLPFHGRENRQTDFRNPQGVSMKLGNFLALDPQYHGTGLGQGSKLDKVVWDRYAGNSIELASVAAAIRNSNDAILQAEEADFDP